MQRVAVTRLREHVALDWAAARMGTGVDGRPATEGAWRAKWGRLAKANGSEVKVVLGVEQRES